MTNPRSELDTGRPSDADRYLAHASAMWTAMQIAGMDPHARDDLGAYLRDLNNPALDEEDRRYIVEAIRELFVFGHCPPDGSLDEWLAFAREDSGEDAHRTIANETLRFLSRYQEAKQRRGLTTQREVADACGLSPTTVCAIETQKVKPQTRTLQKLAEGLGVSIGWLLGEDPTT